MFTIAQYSYIVFPQNYQYLLFRDSFVNILTPINVIVIVDTCLMYYFFGVRSYSLFVICIN